MNDKTQVALRAKFGAAVRARRNELGCRQTDIARRSKLKTTTLGNIECGRFWPSLPALISLCDALRCSPSQIVPQIERAAPPQPVKTAVLRRAGIIDMKAMPRPVIAPEY